MSNPTTPFSWVMPTATDLVTDLPADFEVFGQAVATSMADLLGGTTGQILSKTSNTDMDFTWIANDQGDITAVNVTSPITGGGSAGAVTVGIQDALTTQKGAVQLSDSTSTTSSILASTPTATKAAYDLAAAAVPKSTVTTSGDIIYATGSSAVTRLGIGATSTVLTVAGGVPTWATPAAPGGMTLLSTTTLSGATVTLSSISQSYKNLYLLITGANNASVGAINKIGLNGSYTNASTARIEARANAIQTAATNASFINIGSPNGSSTANAAAITIYNYTSTTGYKNLEFYYGYVESTGNEISGMGGGTGNTNTAITSLTINCAAGTFVGGTALLYGVN